MKAEVNIPDRLFLTEGEKVERILRRAVRHALLAHKRAGHSVAVWEHGRVVLVPADEIQVEEWGDEGQ
jgi:hypothetical protein